MIGGQREACVLVLGELRKGAGERVLVCIRSAFALNTTYQLHESFCRSDIYREEEWQRLGCTRVQISCGSSKHRILHTKSYWKRPSCIGHVGLTTFRSVRRTKSSPRALGLVPINGHMVSPKES